MICGFWWATRSKNGLNVVEMVSSRSGRNLGQKKVDQPNRDCEGGRLTLLSFVSQRTLLHTDRYGNSVMMIVVTFIFTRRSLLKSFKNIHRQYDLSSRWRESLPTTMTCVIRFVCSKPSDSKNEKLKMAATSLHRWSVVNWCFFAFTHIVYWTNGRCK